MRGLLRRRRRRPAIFIALAVTGIVPLIIEQKVGFDLLSSRTEVQPTAAPEATRFAPVANPLELSVFDQPRDVPEIRFMDAEERALTLADFRGKVILLNMWATWCVPCRKEMPALDRLQAQLGGNNFLVLPLSIDRGGLPAVKRFYDELGLQKLGIYVDGSGAGSRALGVPGIPTTLLIDRDGREVARKMGAAEWDGPEMVSLVERTMRARSVSGENRDR